MKPVKNVDIINIGNITDSFNFDIGNVLSDINVLNNNAILSNVLNGNSILDGGILNGNDIDVSPNIDLGLVGDIGSVLPVLSNNIASPVSLVSDVLTNTGDLSVLSNIANLDVGGVAANVVDAVDVLSNITAEDGLVNVLNDALNLDTGNILDTDIISTVATSAGLTDLIDANGAGALIKNVTTLLDTDVGNDLIDAVANLNLFGITGNGLGSLTGGVDLAQIGGGIDLGDVGALISTQAIADILPLNSFESLAGQIDLFDVIDADAA